MNKKPSSIQQSTNLTDDMRQRLSRLGLSDKLFITFFAAALMTLIIAVIGWLSFQQVVSTQRAIVDDAIPAMHAVEALARSNSAIIAIAPQLANTQSIKQFTLLKKNLQTQVSQMHIQLQELGQLQFQPGLIIRLETTVNTIADNLAQQSLNVQERLLLGSQENKKRLETGRAAQELVSLAETLVANSTTATTAAISGLYSTIELQDGLNETIYESLDRLIEVDIDTMERMSELQLTCFLIQTYLEQLERETRIEYITKLSNAFERALQILKRRIGDISDPQRRTDAIKYYDRLKLALSKEGLFKIQLKQLELKLSIDHLRTQEDLLAARLNGEAGDLLNAGAEAINVAGKDANHAVDRGFTGFLVVAGLMIFALIVTLWILTRFHIVGRLHGMETAVRAIGSGDYNVPISTTGKDELAQLGQALEQFRENAIERLRLEAALKDHQHDLEQQVESRTEELRESNDLLAIEVNRHALARQDAEQANQAKTTFLATVSHELRTPLSGVLGTLQLLRETGLKEKQEEYARLIRTANTTLLEILNDMLGFSQIDAGKLHFQRIPFDLRETVDNILLIQGVRAQAKGIVLVREIDDGVPDRIVGDRGKLNQILLNLSGNAVKFTDQGTVTIHVETIPFEPCATVKVRFTVSDTGIGIPTEKVHEVFNPFYQVDDKSHRQQGGTGLGLAICKRLVEAMGGEITINSKTGEGTSIHFYLDFEPAPPASAVIDTPQELIVSPNINSLNILVVEDDEVNRMVCLRYLEALGHKPLEASDGVEALARLQQATESIDAILMDISLPGASGIEVAIEIRNLADGKWEQVPIIAMSAQNFNDSVDNYIAAGMIEFLSKPFDRSQLSAALSRIQVDDHFEIHSKQWESPKKSDDNKVNTEPLDFVYLQGELDSLGTDTLKRLQSLLGSEFLAAIDILKAARDTEDWHSLAQRAHRFKSSVGNLGLQRLVKGAAEIQSLVEIEAPDKSKVGQAIEQLEHNYQADNTQLTGWLNTPR